jgi:hypothetical protein
MGAATAKPAKSTSEVDEQPVTDELPPGVDTVEDDLMPEVFARLGMGPKPGDQNHDSAQNAATTVPLKPQAQTPGAVSEESDTPPAVVPDSTATPPPADVPNATEVPAVEEPSTPSAAAPEAPDPAALQEQLKAAETAAETLRQDLAKARAENPPADAILRYANNPEELKTRLKELDDFEEWALKHWDGVEATDDQPGYSSDQVRERYAALKRERERTLPEVQRALAARRAQETEARKVIPALADPKHPLTQLYDRVMHGPDPRTQPNFIWMFLDSLQGENLRIEAAKRRTAPVPTVPSKPPKAPIGGSSAPGKSAVRPTPSQRRGGELNVEKLKAANGSRAGLVASLMESSVV